MHFFAVCDGHGMFGQEISSYVKYSLPQMLSQQDMENDAHVKLEKTFVKIHEELKNFSDCSRSGTTCCSVFFNGRYLICANVGDSRAIVINSSGRVTQLSTDHKPDLPQEKNRIIKNGGRVYARRTSQSSG